MYKITQSNTLNLKLPNSQLNLNLSSIVVDSSNDDTKFPHKLLLTNTQVLKICKDFGNGSSANIKFSKIQLSKMIQLGEILMSGDFMLN